MSKEEFISFIGENDRLRCLADCPLAPYSTFRIGGEADFVFWPDTPAQLESIAEAADRCGLRFVVMGNASNVLFDDDGFRGVVIFTTRMKKIALAEGGVRVQSGAPLTAAATLALRASLSGMEFTYGIPGSVGGAVFMNAGAFKGEMKDIVAETVCYDCKTHSNVTFRGDEHAFGYRDSVFMRSEGRYIILETLLRLEKGVKKEIRDSMAEHMQYRKTSQPLEFPSAGSVFKRYPGHYTSRLIEEAGLKGKRIGGAEVSHKHAGFIVNRGDATAADVLALIEHIKETIFAKNGIRIECEIRYIPAILPCDGE